MPQSHSTTAEIGSGSDADVVLPSDVMKTKLGLGLVAVVCTLAFAFLMTFRDEFHNVWGRAAIAACAFAVMGLLASIVAVRKRPNLSGEPK